MYDSHLEQLPPELLEKIFKAFVADVKQLKHIAQTCSKFHFVVLKVNNQDYMSYQRPCTKYANELIYSL